MTEQHEGLSEQAAPTQPQTPSQVGAERTGGGVDDVPPVSDGDGVAGNPDSASPAEPDLPEDVGPDAVPPANAESNEYDGD